MVKPLGYILYEGPSQLDGKPIVVILTGVSRTSKNVKTGAMAQVYILRSDVSPIDAVKTGEDVSICGDCKHIGHNWKGRSCYVRVEQGPNMVFGAYVRGRYADVRHYEGELQQIASNLPLRIGAYGDPAAVPFFIWEALLSFGWQGVTSYTHQWVRYPELATFCMASVDTLAEQVRAKMLGFRTFRVRAVGNNSHVACEVVCPASQEAGFKTVCVSCKACGGISFAKAKADIVITVHGRVRTFFKEA